MSGNIKGITIEFNANTSELKKKLHDVSKSTTQIDKELRKVNNALKFNPTSVELWRQKQELLRQKIGQTKEKLDVLKKMQAQMDANGVDKNSQEYRELRRQIIETESKLKTFKHQLNEVGNASLKALSEQFKRIGKSATTIGKTMTASVTGPIVAGYTVAANYASDYEENLNKIDTAFGKNSKSVKEWANTASKEFGLSKVQATESASAFGALGKGIGLTEKDAASMSTTLAGLSADLGSYFNVGVDESSKALEGIFTGESEALKKFGVVMTDTNLQQFAEDQGLVWKEMSQTEKTMLRYDYVLAKTKDAQGDFSRTSDGTANSTKIFKSSIQDLATSIGTNLLPIITPIIQKITEWVNKFNELSPQAQKIITIIGLIVAAAGPLIAIIGTLISSIGTIAGAIGLLAGPVGIVIAIIGALIAIGVLLYKNWDTIKAKVAALKASLVATWEGIKKAISDKVRSIVTDVAAKFGQIKAKATSIFNAVKTAITKPIETARDKIKGIIDKIKSFFHFKVHLPHIDLPHFKVSPAGWKIGDLLKGVIPSLSIAWHKEGGIFEKPTVFAHGIGEAGAEAVIPLDKFWKKLDQMQGGNNININVYGAEGQSAKEIADEVRKMLIKETNRRKMAWQ